MVLWGLGAGISRAATTLRPRDKHRQQLPGPRRNKSCLEWSRDLLGRDTVNLEQHLLLDAKGMDSLTYPFLF